MGEWERNLLRGLLRTPPDDCCLVCGKSGGRMIGWRGGKAHLRCAEKQSKQEARRDDPMPGSSGGCQLHRRGSAGSNGDDRFRHCQGSCQGRHRDTGGYQGIPGNNRI